MALLKSISGIRGTIGGKSGQNLTPEDIVSSAAAYGTWLLHSGVPPRVVIGRDARPSGELVTELVAAALQALGIDVIDLGLATTPTVEMAVPHLAAGGGIILTASHNPREWNALKLLNAKGEFISAADGQRLMRLLQDGDISYAGVDDVGSRYYREGLLDYHLEQIFAHPLVDVDAIRARGFRIALDAVNSVGALAIPALVEALGGTCAVLNGELNGQFAHNPEPLPQHLHDLTNLLAEQDLDLGVAVDPDADRLALVGPGGRWIGEEYTLVTVADYVLQHRPGPTVSNLSSSRALRDLTHRYGQTYYAAKVGEVNVVAKMKEVGAVIGGEGNGGIIDPELHYGRDALIGLALVLSYLATSGKTINELRDSYADYEMVKDKVALRPKLDVSAKLATVEAAFAEQAEINKADGLKLDFSEGWVHLRSSNTEPIVRIYAEAESATAAEALVAKVRAVFEG
jgi:phosphomannomutase